MGGMKKNHIKQTLKNLRRVKTWQLLLILVLMLFIEATIMRFDHINMTDLKKEVIAADEAGNDEEIASAVQRLKTFVFSHTVINIVERNGTQEISFGTGPIYLEHQYQRKASEAIAVAEAQAGTDENPNGNVFAAAMNVCKPSAIRYGWAWNSPEYLDCMTGEIAKYPASESLQDTFVATLPSTALFRYDFSSPIWTPTLSGFMSIICIIMIFIILAKFIIWCFFRLALVFLKK